MKIIETTIHYFPDQRPNTEKEKHPRSDRNRTTFNYPFDQKLIVIKNPPSFRATYLYNGEVKTRESCDAWTINSVDFVTPDPNVTKIVYLYNP